MAGNIAIGNSNGKVLKLIYEDTYDSDETIDVIKTKDDLHAHTADTSNPHGVTKAQVGLDNVDNTSDATKNNATVTLTNKTIESPVINTPTGITKDDVGLDKVDNTSDVDKSVKDSTQLGSIDADKYSQLAADETVSGSKTWSSDTLLMTNLPTSDPSVNGQLWNDSGTLKVSAG